MSAALNVPLKPSPAVVAPLPGSAYSVSIGYLRAFITLLVVAHHSMLAYLQYIPGAPTSLNGPSRWWEASPVMDAQRTGVFNLLVSFNDIFFMSLMFFVSGLFLWQSLQRKGAGQFLRDRALRLGIPFVVAAAIVAPVAYYPAYLQTGLGGGIAGFWQQWRSLGNWPAGPAWFVWVLLAFDVIAAALFVVLPKWGEAIGRLTSQSNRRPIILFALLVVLSAAAYVPLAVIFTPVWWSSFGPFSFQTSRAMHYLIYFLLGTGVGAYGLSRGLVATDGKLARRWWMWSIAAVVAFAIASAVGLATMTAHIGSRGWEVAAESTWVLSCAASSLAFLAIFVRFTNNRRRVFDSLTANAYGIYLVHYAFVSWLQYALLRTSLPAIAKGSIVIIAAVLLSWGTTAALRRIRLVARIL